MSVMRFSFWFMTRAGATSSGPKLSPDDASFIPRIFYGGQEGPALILSLDDLSFILIVRGLESPWHLSCIYSNVYCIRKHEIRCPCIT